jgi:periplasmic copper chaperone A
MPSSTRRGALRVGTVLVPATAVTLVDAAPAFAHMTDTAGTVALHVTLPTDHPITSTRTAGAAR